MTYAELLLTAGFNEVEQARLISLSCRFPKIQSYAEAFMAGDRSWDSFNKAVELTDSHATREASAWALDMVFLCHAFALLQDVYRERGLSFEMFRETSRDLMYKTRECITVYGDIGTVSVTWYWEFLNMSRFAFGRLQFGSRIKGKDLFKLGNIDGYEKNGVKIDPEDVVLDCHIPSGGKLTQELCFDSYRRAWEFNKHLWSDGIMRAYCGTHLFYPPYRELFGKNTQAFADNFDLFLVEETEDFGDAWRFLDTNDISDLSALPTRTSTQRRFIEYMKNGGKFGRARGFLIFDGERILNK